MLDTPSATMAPAPLMVISEPQELDFGAAPILDFTGPPGTPG